MLHEMLAMLRVFNVKAASMPNLVKLLQGVLCFSSHRCTFLLEPRTVLHSSTFGGIMCLALGTHQASLLSVRPGARAQVRSSFESDMRLQFGNLNFTGRGFSSDFSSVAEDYGGGGGYEAGASAAAQALAEPPAASPVASSSAAMDAFKAAGEQPRP